jgi:hypothetical protein
LETLPDIEKPVINRLTNHFATGIATVDASGKRKWVFAKKPKGRYYNIRSYVSWLFFGLFFLLPFIYVHGKPLFLFNVTRAGVSLFSAKYSGHRIFLFSELR